MSSNAIIAAPLIASYSIFSVILSRIFLKEKLSKAQYAVIIVADEL
jgi:drug/metabolite transporter (DMT)-like permease